MKKKLILLIFVIVLFPASALIMTGCDLFGSESPQPGKPDGPPPPAPVLEKTSFAIRYESTDGKDADYRLTWNVTYATSYTFEFENGETGELSHPILPIDGLDLEEEQTVTVRAFNGTSGSNPVTVKFKGIKLSAPVNVRFSASSGIEWDGGSNGNPFGVEYTRLDGQDRPAGEPVQSVTWQYNHSVDFVRSNFKNFNLCDFVQETRIRSLVNTGKVWNFGAGTPVLVFDLPSAPSESAVRILGVGMSNPSSLRWKEPQINPYDTRGVNYFYGIEWNPVSDYKTLVSVYGGSGSIENPGVSETNIYLSSEMSGEYRITAQSVNTTVDYLPTFFTHRIYVSLDPEEELTFTVNRIELQTPANVRVDGENIVWDAVEYARDYTVQFNEPGDTGDTSRYFFSESNTLPFTEVFDQLDGRDNYDAVYNITVSAAGIGAVRKSFTNNTPVFEVYHYTGFSAPAANAHIQLKSIEQPKNIHVDKTNNTVSWNKADDAESYEVGFYSDSGSGTATTQIPNLYYEWFDFVNISQVATIEVKAIKSYEYKLLNAIPTLIMSSVTVIKL